MSSLAPQLQAAAMDPTKEADDLLRMALVIATKLKLNEFRQWCEADPEGYEKQKVPPYQRVPRAPLGVDTFTAAEMVVKGALESAIGAVAAAPTEVQWAARPDSLAHTPGSRRENGGELAPGSLRRVEAESL